MPLRLPGSSKQTADRTYLRAAFHRHMSGAGALGVDVVGRCWRCDHAHCDGSCHVRLRGGVDERIRTLLRDPDRRETHARLDHADGDPNRLHEEEYESSWRYLPGPEIDFQPRSCPRCRTPLMSDQTPRWRDSRPSTSMYTLRRHMSGRRACRFRWNSAGCWICYAIFVICQRCMLGQRLIGFFVRRSTTSKCWRA